MQPVTSDSTIGSTTLIFVTCKSQPSHRTVKESCPEGRKPHYSKLTVRFAVRFSVPIEGKVKTKHRKVKNRKCENQKIEIKI